MKYFPVIICVCFSLLFAGCGNVSDDISLDGTWRGTLTERGKSTLVELELSQHNSTIEGSLTILTETGSDVEKGRTFPIVQAEQSGKSLTFVIPISGKNDDDTIAFDLTIERDSLTGYGYERREGSDQLPITFTRQK